MSDINVRVGQSEGIKVLSTGGGGLLTVPQDVVGGIANITALNVSGLSTFIGVSTFHDQVYTKGSFQGLSFEGISGVTTVGSLVGLTTVIGDLYIGGSLKIAGTASTFHDIVATGTISAKELSTGTPGNDDWGISLFTGNGGESGIATITSSNQLFISPTDVYYGEDEGSVLKPGTVIIDGNLEVYGSTISQSNQIIEIGDFRVGLASTIQSDATIDGAGIGIGSTNKSGKPATISIYNADGYETPGGTNYPDVGTGVTCIGGSGRYLFVDYIASGGVIGTVTISAGSTARDYVPGEIVAVEEGDQNGNLVIDTTENDDYFQKLFTFDNNTDTLRSNIGLGVGVTYAFKSGTDMLLNRTTLGPTVVGSSLTTIGATLYQDLSITGILSSTGGIDGGSY